MSAPRKLTDAQREAISGDRRLNTVIAAEYGVTVTTVRRIKSGEIPLASVQAAQQRRPVSDRHYRVSW